MNIDGIKADIQEKEKQMKAIKADALKQYKLLFQEASVQLFESQPDLQSFSWTQYTPYWNDGDVCTFGANIEDPGINGSDPYDDDVDQKLSVAVFEFLSAFSEESLEDMFGDHCEITVKRTNGKPNVTVDEYEHD